MAEINLAVWCEESWLLFCICRLLNLVQRLQCRVIVGLNISCPGCRFQVVSLFNIRIVYLVDCNTLCSLGIQSILQIASDLLLLLSKFHEIFSVDGVTLSVSVSVRIRVASVCPLTLTASERIAAGVLPALCQSVYLLLERHSFLRVWSYKGAQVLP